MSRITLNQFSEGMSLDAYQRGGSPWAVIKNFDIFRSPTRLFPSIAMVADTTGQNKVGNLLTGSDGKIYGLGTVDSVGNDSQDIYVKATPLSDWAQIHANKLRSGQTVDYRGFVEYKAYFYAFNQNRYLGKYDRAGSAAADPTFFDLTSFTNVCNPVIHPKDDIMYLGVDNKIYSVNDTTKSGVLLTLPSTLKITALSWYGNFLAIACSQITSAGIGNAALRSVVYLWDRDSSLATVSESIEWGTGEISVMNNIDGILMTIGNSAGVSTYAVDRDSLQIKAYNGGSVQLVKEIFTIKQTTTRPSVTVNSRVDFVYQNRWYFSADVVGGSTSPSLKGLWSIGRSKATGNFVLCIEQLSGTTVLAAATVGDYLVTVNTAVGTITVSNIADGDTPAVTYQTATIDTVVNPGMPLEDTDEKKQLVSVGVKFLELSTGQDVSIYYRVDSEAEADWVLIKTDSTVGDTFILERSTTGLQFTAGRNYEFRISSGSGTIIHSFSYRYNVLNTNL